ncbi:hypothetical protein VNO77_23778 [Canavalia gladiata]|uniref:Uncharacterized protein n=1 Tax=Canavalia gladiata TaxID=3824 RepID=A0AAN9L8D6_CANGL
MREAGFTEQRILLSLDSGGITDCCTFYSQSLILQTLLNEVALLAGRENNIVMKKINLIQAVEKPIVDIEKTAKWRESGKGVVGAAIVLLLRR